MLQSSRTRASLRVAAARMIAVSVCLAACLFAPAEVLGEDAPVSFAGASLEARVAAVEAAFQTDSAGTVKALVAMGSPKNTDPSDFALLLELSTKSADRVTRLLALGSLRDIDGAKALEEIRKRADGENQLPTVFSIEGMALLGSHDDVPRLLELAGSRDSLIAAAALRALPRLADKKDLDQIIDVSLRQEELRLADYGAWAAQDISKKQESVVKAYEKIAKKKGDDRASGASSVVAMLGDNPPPPHKWGDELTQARSALLGAPSIIGIDARNARHREKLEAALAWMKENVPTFHLMLRASAKVVRMPGENPNDLIDVEGGVALVPLNYSGHSERQLAYHLARSAGILFQKKLGNPCEGHRGWELPIFDSYDVCVAAKLYDAGPGRLPRKTFVQDRINGRPWDGT